MYGISPEDRLWMANRDHAERRQLATADRMAATRRDGRTDAASAGTSLLRRPLTAVSHAVHALTHVRLHVPTHGAAH